MLDCGVGATRLLAMTGGAMVKNIMKIRYTFFFFIFLLVGCSSFTKIELNKLQQIPKCYPDHIIQVTATHLIWKDGTQMPIGEKTADKRKRLEDPSFLDQISLSTDLGRSRYLPFFKKMYGQTKQDVEKNLIEIAWLPKTF